MHIAVADDDDDTRTLMVSALRRCGYEVYEARDGEELLSHCEVRVRDRQPTDVVVTDIGMPGCDGVNATKALLSQCPLLRIILVTGFRDAETWKHAYASGAVLVLGKPVPVDRLVAAVAAAAMV